MIMDVRETTAGAALRASSRPLDAALSTFPLTHRQSLFWLDAQLFPDAPYHHVALTVRMRGALDRQRFLRAFDETVRAIDKFCLVFYLEDGEPCQAFAPDAAPLIEELDLSKEPSGFEAWMAARCARRFDLSQRGYDAVLVRLSEDEHVFYLCLHHIISDGTSVSLFLRDLAKRYAGEEVAQRPSFAAYVQHERAYRKSPKAERASRYYAAKLGNASSPLQLYGRVHKSRSVGVERSVVAAGRARWQRLTELTHDPRVEFLDVSMSRLVALSTVLFAYLYRVTGTRSLVLGTPVPNRNANFGDTCGLLMEQVFLAVEVEEGETFGSLASKVRSELFQTLRHSQQCVSDRGVHYATLNLLRIDEPTWPDLETEVALSAAPSTGLHLEDVGDKRDTFAVHILGFERDETLRIGFDFHRDTFEPELRERAKRHYLAVLDAFLEELDTPIDRVVLVDERERAALIRLGQGASQPEPPEDPLLRLLKTADLRAQHPAIHFAHGQLLYADLIRQVGQLSARLLQLGVVRGSRVGICVPRGPDEPIAMLAAWACGGAYVPLDPTHPASRIRIILEDAAPEVLVTHSSVASELDVPPGVRVLLLDAERASLDGLDPHFETNVSPEQVGYVLFTSGSTGRPKGVEVSRGAMANFLRSMAHSPGMTERDRLLSVTTITFDIAGLELLLPLWVGASVQIADRETVLDPVRLRHVLETQPISVMQATPTTWRFLLEAGFRGTPNGLTMLCGGEPMSPELAHALSLCGDLWNMYGPTETTVWSTLKRITSKDARITIGRPIDETQVFVLDEKAMLLPEGVVGELCIGGQGVALGYLERPELTAEKFIASPYGEPGARLYRTGDLARFLPSGELECLGRVDQQVKIRGFRIELGEIESCLRGVSGIREAVVVARTDATGGPQLVAYYVGETGLLELRERVRRALPTYMHPAAYMNLAAFPLNTNGKVDRKLLPQPEMAPREEGAFDAPSTDDEVEMASLFQEVLALSHVSVTRDFFSLGGDSARVLTLRRRIQQTFGVELPLNILFEAPTVRELARRLQPALDPLQPAFVCLRPAQSDEPPLLCLVGVALYWPLAAALRSRRAVYGVHIPYRVQSEGGLPTVEDIAARYVALIRERVPEGPYHLAGLCFGGLIAFEVARQLQAMGERVDTVAIFDATLPESTHFNVAKRVSELVSQLRAGKSELWRLAKRAQIKFGEARVRRRGVVAGSSVAQDFEVLGPLADAVVHSYARKATSYSGSLSVFRASERREAVWLDVDWDLGWERRTAALEVFPVPGSHLDILKAPNVEVLAHILSRKLAEPDNQV